MPLKKCCVGGCNSTNETCKLFCLPKNDYWRNRWLSLLVPTNTLLGGLAKDQLLYKRVCERHFDRYQFDAEGKRLRYSYPTLFTDEEIRHGEPRPSVEAGRYGNDHTYCKESIDKEDFDGSLLVIGQADSRPQISREHCYCIRSGSSVRQRNGDENSSSSANIPQTSPDPKPFVEDNVPPTEDAIATEDDQINDDTETIEKETFSWQKANQICLDDEDEIWDNTVVVETKVEESETNIGLELKYWESEEKKSDKEHINHKEYICNNCSKRIDGFRYTCVSCENYDLCRDCETDMTHPEHCMLRIPESRPKDEIQSILEAIRDKMKSLSEELEQNQIALDEIKVEVDFDNPPAMDPLTSPQSGAQLEATDVICHVLTSDVTSYDVVTSDVTSYDVLTSDVTSYDVQTSDTAPSVARRKHSEPPERLARTRLQPQTVPATKTPIVHLKKLKLTADVDGDNPKTYSKRRKLCQQIEDGFARELEETWLDEDILKEENRIFDVDESSVSHTRNSKLNVRQTHSAASGPS